MRWVAVSLWLIGASHVAVAGALERQVVEVGGQEISLAFSDGPGRAARLEARCVVPARRDVVWTVLTDYDHLEGVVPFLTDSHTVEPEPGVTLLRQEGRIGLLVFSRRFKVRAR